MYYYYLPEVFPNYYPDSHRPLPQPQPHYPIAPHWGHTETHDNLEKFKNQYIRVHIVGMGWVVAQLLGTEPGGVVTLNVYTPGNPVPGFYRINRRDLTGLSPLGFTPPPEIFVPAPPPPKPYPWQ